MPDPQVSVVIPTRDRWPLLRQALDSVAAQRDVSFEVLVVDDGSSAETADQAARLGDPRVRVLASPSRGVAAARNAGIEQASAPWIAFLDDDDLWSPEKLVRQLAAAEAANAGWAYSAAVYVDADLEVTELVPPPAPDKVLREVVAANTIPAGASNVIVRADVVRALGSFDVSFQQLEDWDLWIRLAASGPPGVCPEPLVAYRMHAGNRILRDEPGVLEEVDRLAAKHRELEARTGASVDRVRQTRWIAWLLRRQGRRGAAAGIYLRGALRYRSPGNVVRAVGALAGERVMRGPPSVQSAIAPSWLDTYRASS